MTMEMTEGAETEVLPDEEVSDSDEYLEGDGSLSGEDQDVPENTETDDEETENNASDTETDETEGADTESPETEDGLPEAETDTDGTDISAESLNVTGDILILPEGYELFFEESGLDGDMGTGENAVLSSEQFGQISEQLEQVIETVSVQNDALYGGTAVICLMLGVISGILLIHGFRLRRV